MGLLHTMTTTAVRIADEQYVEEEITYLRQALQIMDTYGKHKETSNQTIKNNHDEITDESEDNIKGIAILLYIHGVTNRNSSLTSKFNIKIVFNTCIKIENLFRNSKDKF